MSSRNYFVSGYGFPVEDIKNEDTLRFIQKHGEDLMRMASFFDTYYEAVCDLLEAIRNENIGADYKITGRLAEKLEELNISECDDAYWGLDIVCDIINEEHDLQVGFERGQEDCLGLPCILIPALMPWQYTDRMRGFDQPTVEHLLKGYVKELGLDVHIGELEVEYYG